MSEAAYDIGLVTCGVVAAVGSALGMRRWGVRGLLAAASLVALFLLGSGYVDYQAQSNRDTPLRAYVLGSTCSTLLAAVVVWVLARRRVNLVLQIALGAIAWLGCTLLIALSTVFL
jgi:hypothetical protein